MAQDQTSNHSAPEPAHNAASKRTVAGIAVTPDPDPVIERVRAAEDELGTNPLVDWLVRLLTGQARPGDTYDPDIVMLGGMEPVEEWMARVWAAQALKHVWHHQAARSVETALEDEVWQVRLMAVEVAALRELSDLASRITLMVSDPHPKVRSTAARALGSLAAAQDEQAVLVLNEAVMSTDSALADAADEALSELARRFNNPNLAATPGADY